jgi:hypothetical protein
MSKEWSGESGYCNCLLVVMARAYVSSVRLSPSGPVPNLEQLAFRNSATVEWVKAQEFDYAALDPTKIIQTLIESSNVSRSFLGRKKYAIATVDVVGTHGPELARVYDLTLNKSKEGVELTITLRGDEE